MYQIKAFKMLFHPRRYNLMSENVLNSETKFNFVLAFVSLLKRGPYTGKFLSLGCSDITKPHVTITTILPYASQEEFLAYSLS